MTHRLEQGAAFERAAALAQRPERALLGITGPPAAGKSTYAERLTAELSAAGYEVALVPMDGFHLAQGVLEKLGLAEVKGAPHTFDAAGFVALLARLAFPGTETVWAPRFDRDLEDSIAAAIGVTPTVQLVVVEGNYLLLDQGAWAGVRPLLADCWYLDLPDDVRHERLEARHRHHGRSVEEAHNRTYGSDEANAQVIAATAHLADVVIQQPG